MKPVERLRAALRQRRQPTSFRIAPPGDDDEVVALLTQLVRSFPQEEQQQEQKPEVDDKALADAATNLWRAQRRLAHGAQTARDRQTGRYLRSCRDALQAAGLVVQDHDGDAFHPGRSIEVLAVEEVDGRTDEVVSETVRPTIYLHDRRIQMGQVIVAGPSSTQPPREA
ncbi:hypothetical protein [Cryptosporangium sp. NPDC048952]|uniref:hypothetical protein n=1 Tax=Cryptosporangium sp. NPDC048952 TaxID=3363961 RepID=UPI00371E9E8D